MVTVSPMPAKANPAWIRAPYAFCPTVGANCHCFANRAAIGVGVWRFVEGVCDDLKFDNKFEVPVMYSTAIPGSCLRYT
jgi:hypothetical protein